MAQIGGYLTPLEHDDFKSYSIQFCLSESALANLLLVRELRLQRLHNLKSKYLSRAPSDSRQRVTAHQPNAELKTAFEARSIEEGLKPDQAASILYRAELDERWLEKSITC